MFLVAAWRELGSGGEADCCADLSSREATQAKSMNRAGFRKHPPKSSGCGLRWRFTRHWRNLTSVTPVQCGWNLPSANPTTVLFGKYHVLWGFVHPQLRSSVHVGTNLMLLFRFVLRAELLLMPHIYDLERHSIQQPVPHVDTRSYKHILTRISAGLVAKFQDHQKNAMI